MNAMDKHQQDMTNIFLACKTIADLFHIYCNSNFLDSILLSCQIVNGIYVCS